MNDQDKPQAEGAPTPPAPQIPPPQPPLAPCPCGQVPERLMIEMPQRAKYGLAMGDCCAEWAVEFRNGYTDNPNETAARAREAWDAAPRGAQVPASSDA